ncbi:MAG: hypothetical protein NTY02_19495 [Acidobacteria bacterium]|nr:hypothetical protein [Acidobacteriota bacterium]
MISGALSTSRRFAHARDRGGKLGEFCQLLFPLLNAHADDFGRLAGDAFTVKALVLPTSPRREADFETALGVLTDVGLIQRAVVGGQCVIQVVGFDNHQTGLHRRTTSKYPEIAPENGDCMELPGTSENFRGIPSEEKRTEEKRREGKGREGASAHSDPITALVELWNAGTTPPIARCLQVSETRRRKAQARLQERVLDEWSQVIGRIEASPFCRGENDRGWVATFDWLLQPDVAVKVLEGKYDARPRVVPLKPVDTGPTDAEVAADVRQRLAARRANGGRP